MPANVKRWVKMKVLERDGYACRWCGRHSGLGVMMTIDHRIPRSRGGRNSRKNLSAVCLRCNQLKGSMTDGEYKYFLVDLCKDIDTVSRLRLMKLISPYIFSTFWRQLRDVFFP